MSGYGTPAPNAHAAARNAISVPFVVVAALLAGLGLWSLLTWLMTFNWLYFAGIAPMLAGALMLFHRLAGSDRAE